MDQTRFRSRSSSRRQREQEEEEQKKKQLLRKRLLYYGAPAAVVLVLLVAYLVVGGSRAEIRTVFPDAKVKMDRLYGAYRAYCDKTKKAPASEQALKDFLQALPPADQQALGLPGSLDELFVNPRDGQKYEVRWGTMAGGTPAGLKAVVWEKTSDDGKRWATLGNGQVDQFTDEEFAGLRK
jgi:hypothetical protein